MAGWALRSTVSLVRILYVWCFVTSVESAALLPRVGVFELFCQDRVWLPGPVDLASLSFVQLRDLARLVDANVLFLGRLALGELEAGLSAGGEVGDDVFAQLSEDPAGFVRSSVLRRGLSRLLSELVHDPEVLGLLTRRFERTLYFQLLPSWEGSLPDAARFCVALAASNRASVIPEFEPGAGL